MQFKNMEMTVDIVHCSPLHPVKRSNSETKALKENLNVMFPSLEIQTTKGQSHFQHMVNQWGKAKVHAEAILMAWVYKQGQLKHEVRLS